MPTDSLTAAQYAKLHGVSVQRVKQWLKAKRIPGACKFGRVWAIPKGAKRPERTR